MSTKNWLLILLSAVIVFACGDDDSSPAFPNAPEARSENDNSSKGVYKGVLIGSSGYVKVNIDNRGDGNISLTLNIDGNTYELTTEQEYNSELGVFQGYFRGTISGNIATIGFYAMDNGRNYGFFDVSIPGHPNVCLQLIKEKSNAVVKCYAGTYSGAQSGTINFVITGDEWSAIARETGGLDCSDLSGSINGSTLVCDCDFDGDGSNDLDFTGTVSGNSLSGTYSAGDASGTWSANRIF